MRNSLKGGKPRARRETRMTKMLRNSLPSNVKVNNSENTESSESHRTSDHGTKTEIQMYEPRR